MSWAPLQQKRDRISFEQLSHSFNIITCITCSFAAVEILWPHTMSASWKFVLAEVTVAAPVSLRRRISIAARAEAIARACFRAHRPRAAFSCVVRRDSGVKTDLGPDHAMTQSSVSSFCAGLLSELAYLKLRSPKFKICHILPVSVQIRQACRAAAEAAAAAALSGRPSGPVG